VSVSYYLTGSSALINSNLSGLSWFLTSEKCY